MTDIIGFNGPPRSGKTAALAALALYRIRHGHTVLSNFEIKGAKLVDIPDLVKMLKYAMETETNRPLYPNHDLYAQELFSWLESRVGHDKAVLLMGYFFLYAGKMGFGLIGYDAQLNSSVDKRLKYNASARFEAENRVDRFVYWELDLEHTEENVRTGRKVQISKSYMQRQVFPFYNTYKVSKPIGFDRWLASCGLDGL